MKTLLATLTALLALTLAACAPKGGSADTPTAKVALPMPTPVPGATPTPTPTPTATPLPTPVPTFNTTNHPLSNTTQTDVNGNTFRFNSDGTTVFTDSIHISYGHWTPDPNMAHVVTIGGFMVTVQYPINLTTTGVYICLPAGGPQNCMNYGYVGDVTISLNQGKYTILY